jgi:hypothetical protein
MKLVSEENLKVKKIEKEILNENFKQEEIIEEMFSVKDIENKINQSIEVIADKVVDKMLNHFMKNDKLMDAMSESILKKINIKVEKV